jgi:hypothetical protein
MNCSFFAIQELWCIDLKSESTRRHWKGREEEVVRLGIISSLECVFDGVEWSFVRLKCFLKKTIQDRRIGQNRSTKCHESIGDNQYLPYVVESHWSVSLIVESFWIILCTRDWPEFESQRSSFMLFRMRTKGQPSLGCRKEGSWEEDYWFS